MDAQSTCFFLDHLVLFALSYISFPVFPSSIFLKFIHQKYLQKKEKKKKRFLSFLFSKASFLLLDTGLVGRSNFDVIFLWLFFHRYFWIPHIQPSHTHARKIKKINSNTFYLLLNTQDESTGWRLKQKALSEEFSIFLDFSFPNSHPFAVWGGGNGRRGKKMKLRWNWNGFFVLLRFSPHFTWCSFISQESRTCIAFSFASETTVDS